MLRTLPDKRGSGGPNKEQDQNAEHRADQYIAEAHKANDEGVVGIEYVVITGFVAAGLAVVFGTTDIWWNMLTKLNAVI